MFSLIYGSDMSVFVFLSVSVLSVLLLFPDDNYYVATVYSLFCLSSLTSQNIFSILAGSHFSFSRNMIFKFIFSCRILCMSLH